MTTFDPLMRIMKNICLNILALFLLLSTSEELSSQSIRDTTLQMSTIDFSIGGHMPAGDMADRFQFCGGVPRFDLYRQTGYLDD